MFLGSLNVLKMKSLKVTSIVFLMMISKYSIAQDIVAKLKPEYQSYLSDTGISNKKLNTLLKSMDVKRTSKILKKKHSKPTSLDRTFGIDLKTNRYKENVAKSLQQTGFFEYVQERGNKINTPLSIPNDPFADPITGSQYYLEQINAYKAWDISKGDTNVVICVVDNGIDWNHPEVKSKIKYNQADPFDGKDNDKDGFIDNYIGWDVANNDAFPEDSTGARSHGTSVAAIAAGLTNNNLGIASVGYNCKFIPIKIFKDGNPAGNEAYDGVIYAAEHGCKVINLSWGSVGGFDQYEQAVINYAAIDNDAVVVAASFPREGDFVFTTPADYENVVSVVGLQANSLKGNPQSYHYWLDVSVPTNDITTADLNAGYRTTSGVSLGVPMVSGAAALARSVHPDLNSTQIQELLRVTSTNIDTIGTNKQYKEKMGKGRLDVYKALADTTTPAVRILNYELRKVAGDTISLQLGFRNYLWKTKNLTFDFSQLYGGFQILDSVAEYGVLKMGDSSFTSFANIKVRILPYTANNSSELVRIGIRDTANKYNDYQYFSLDKKIVNPPIITKLITEENTIEVKIFPNPCTEKIYFDLTDAEQISISDLTGKVFFDQKNPSDIVSVNMEELKAGIYLAKIRTKTGTYSSKFIKK
jgi:serine protease